jgi:hypothetical protein
MFDSLSATISGLFNFNKRSSGLSVPILDGALKPNNLLEEAPVLAERAGLEDIAVGPDGALYAACGGTIVKVSASGEFNEVASYEHAITAFAIMPDGSFAVGLGTSVVIESGNGGRQVINHVDGRSLNAVSAIHAAPDGSLLISDGSASRPYSEWAHDLMEKGRTGRLVRFDPWSGTTKTLASGLEYAFGAYADDKGRALVSESWKHQVDVVKDGRTTPVIQALPGYPSRMAPAQGGGLWLTLFACRTQLVEFVLRENDYRREMMRTIEPRYWVAPALSSGSDFREPLQAGGVKQMGILKPWAPPRSYGLVVRYDENFIPVYSLHSRVGGMHHGVVAVAQRGDDLFVLSKGAGRILRLSVSRIEADEAQEAAR